MRTRGASWCTRDERCDATSLRLRRDIEALARTTNRSSKMPTKHYTRYLDLHVTGNDKWYGERAEDIALQLGNPRLPLKQDRTLVSGKRVSHNASMDDSAFPETGYVVDAVVVQHIQQKLSNKYLERLIQWISNEDHTGKM